MAVRRASFLLLVFLVLSSSCARLALANPATATDATTTALSSYLLPMMFPAAQDPSRSTTTSVGRTAAGGRGTAGGASGGGSSEGTGANGGSQGSRTPTAGTPSLINDGGDASARRRHTGAATNTYSNCLPIALAAAAALALTLHST